MEARLRDTASAYGLPFHLTPETNICAPKTMFQVTSFILKMEKVSALF
jgi:hypothetical protein